MDFFLNSKFVISSQNSTFGRKMATFMFTFVQNWDKYKPTLITLTLSLSCTVLFTIYLTTENCTTSVYSSWEALYQAPAESNNDSYHTKNGYLCTCRLLKITNFCQKLLFGLKIQKVDFSQKSIIGFQKFF